MASNGYVREDCMSCIFLTHDSERGHRCTFSGDDKATYMQWVSANGCDENPALEEKYYERCEHYSNTHDVKDMVRNNMSFYRAWNFLNSHIIFNGRFSSDIYIEVVKVNPHTNEIDDDCAKNTKTQVWLEHGPYDTLTGTTSHDIRLDCGGNTFEEAISKLAHLVRKYYPDISRKLSSSSLEDIRALSDIPSSWILSEYNEDTEDQIDYYLNEEACKVGDTAYQYDHNTNLLIELEIVHIISRNDNIELYDTKVANKSVLIEGETLYDASTSAEFITDKNSYLVWFNVGEIII